MKFWEAMREMQENGKRCRMRNHPDYPNVYVHHYDQKFKTFSTDDQGCNDVGFDAFEVKGDWEIVEDLSCDPTKTLWCFKCGIRADAKICNHTWSVWDGQLSTWGKK